MNHAIVIICLLLPCCTYEVKPAIERIKCPIVTVGEIIIYDSVGFNLSGGWYFDCTQDTVPILCIDTLKNVFIAGWTLQELKAISEYKKLKDEQETYYCLP